ncbi:hemerythrin domain-containing protein [Aquibacillus rhizosphaerae]|uniref:Hemerythrin domain-containing protein n=1 Tax=Aquibacillus rhizosphaerae TaxID=3051431 RepID=A0ABT7L5Q2_9BACI|nr:hemerythrin domain-containing protein [Aquibacillus sp. LR5S19]MDL4841202.1 hemerythrin domain-containing protein [Aquibacillus sp. LR5S19]
MVGKQKGLLRHKSLYPLSHHHHHALFLALNLRKIGTEKSKYKGIELKEELRLFWETGGQQHFRDEEEVLLPIYALYGSIEQHEITEMLLEHVKIRSIIFQIFEKNEELEPLMNELGKLLEKHVRKEERVIFPMIEDALPDDVLEGLAPYLHRD